MNEQVVAMPRTRSSRREQNKAENRTALVKAARAVFAEMGYGAASVRDIAWPLRSSMSSSGAKVIPSLFASSRMAPKPTVSFFLILRVNLFLIMIKPLAFFNLHEMMP